MIRFRTLASAAFCQAVAWATICNLDRVIDLRLCSATATGVAIAA